MMDIKTTITNYLNEIKRSGLFKGTYKLVNVLYLNLLINRWTSRRDYLISIRKGKCIHCTTCCYDSKGNKCNHLTQNNLCSIYNNRTGEHLLCNYAPLPVNFRLNPKKWRNCGFYYDK